MKTLALDLDSGRLSRWVGDPRPFSGWSDRYGDVYTLRIHVYRGSGGQVPPCTLRLLVKKTHRRDVKALWDLGTFSRVPSMIAPNFATYVGQVSVSGTAYQQALKIDTSSGNDITEVPFLAVLQVTHANGVTEAEFSYTLVNSGYRAVDNTSSGGHTGGYGGGSTSGPEPPPN